MTVQKVITSPNLQRGRILDGPVDDQVALGKERQHGIRLDGKRPETEETGHAATTFGDESGETEENAEGKNKNQDPVDQVIHSPLAVSLLL